MAGIPALLRMGRCLAHTSELYVMCQMQRMVSGAHSCDMTLWKQQHQQWPQQQRIAFSTQGAGGDDHTGAATTTTTTSSSDPVADQFEQMLEVMMQNPTVMQMMMSRLPAHMQRPEVLKAMLANPEIRGRMSALAQQTGLASIIQGVDMSKIPQGISATLQAGIDPARLVERFRESPSLAKAMENPRVLAALMDLASNGADALKKYEGDKDIIEAAMEAGDILQQLQQEGGSSAGSCGGGASSSGSSQTSSMAAVEQQLGVSPQELMQRLMSRPDLLQKVQDPEVQKALMEVSQSPWKIIKHMFNPKIMGALKEMKDIVQAGKS